jgi:3-phosphoinositide dependent protein kinase-1
LTGVLPFRGENGYQTFQLIKKREMTFPPEISAEAKSLIEGLMVIDHDARLGANGTYDALKAHPFFTGIDWQNLYTTKPPPIVKQ